MKFKMQPKTKKYSLIGVSVGTITLMLLVPLIITVFKIGYIPNVLYSYTYTPQVKYTIGVLKNDLYQQEHLKEDQYYLSKFVESIHPTFSFELKGSSVARISGEYQIVAQIRGYTTKEQKQEIIWQKEFVLVPKVEIQVESDYLKKEHAVAVDLNEYKNFVETIFTEANVRMDAEVCLKMKGQLKIGDQEKVCEVPIDTAMRVPLGQNYFTVIRNGEEAKTESLTDGVIQSPIYIKYIVLLELIIGILGVGVFISIMRANYLTKEEIKRRKIKKIFRLYGSRLIGVDHLGKYPSSEMYQLDCFQSLIKMAEEFEQPIFYLTKEVIEVDCFYLFDKERLYFFQID